MNEKANKILDFMQKNCAWIIAVLTGTGVVTSYLLKFIEFLTAASYFSYYGLDINLYRYNDVGFFNNLSLSILFMLALISLLYYIYQTISNIKEKKWSKVFNKNNISVILLSNSYITLLLNTHITEKSFWLDFLVLIIFEVIFSLMLFGKTKNKVEFNKEDFNLLNLLKRLPFAIIILIFLYVCYVNYDLNDRENYRIINENKVIVYSNNDYSLTLDCEIINDELIIYKGTQEKINNENVYSKYIEFNNVTVK